MYILKKKKIIQLDIITASVIELFKKALQLSNF